MTASTPNDLMKRGSDRLRIAFGIGGLIAVALGIFIIFYPAQSGSIAMKVVAVVIGVYALIVGLIYLGTGIFSKGLTGWSRTAPIALGALYVVGGIILLLNISAAGAVLAVFLSVIIGVLWLLEGIMAFVVVNRGGNNVWGIIYGIISILAGLILIIIPIMGFITLWWLLGFSLVVLGIVQIVRAFQGRRSARAVEA